MTAWKARASGTRLSGGMKGDPTRGQDSIGGRAEGEREGNVTRPHMHATRLLGEKVDRSIF